MGPLATNAFNLVTEVGEQHVPAIAPKTIVAICVPITKRGKWIGHGINPGVNAILIRCLVAPVFYNHIILIAEDANLILHLLTVRQLNLGDTNALIFG